MNNRRLERSRTKGVHVRLVTRVGRLSGTLYDLNGKGAGIVLERHLRALEAVTAIIVLKMGNVTKVHHKKGRVVWCAPHGDQWRIGVVWVGLD